MKLILFSCIAFCIVFGSFAFAQDVAMKKAIKSADEKVAEAVAEMKSKCGNKAVKASVDYAAVQKMTKFAKEDGRTMENMVETAGFVANDYVSRLAMLCGDGDYKSEIGKVTEIKFLPDEAVPKASITKSGTVITIKARPTNAADSFGTEDAYKKLF